MLPKFLLADNFEFPDKVFIVHTAAPKCIIESDVEDFNIDQEVHWIDAKPSDAAAAALLKEAEAYYVKECESLDEYYDEDEDEEEEV
jgi:hypothetical protein